MKNKSKHTIKISFIVVAILVGLFIAYDAYKTYERKAFTDLETSHKTFVAQELASIEQMIISGKDITKEYREDYELNGATLPKDMDAYVEKQKIMFDHFEKNIRARGDRRVVEIAMLSEHSDSYKNFVDKRLRYIYSPQVTLARKLVDSKLAFYENELKDIDRNEARMQYAVNINELRKDNYILGSFMSKMRNMSDAQITNNFSQISALEKYSRDDFSFRNADKIKSYFPYSLESLEKQKKVLKSTYLAIKDLASGNLASAAYKFSRLRQDSADAGSIDEDKMKKDGQEESIAIKQKLSEALLNNLSIAKDLGWNTNLDVCYVYLYKIDQYEIINEKYPNVKNFAGLRQELDSLTPNTSNLDDAINDGLLSYEVTDKDIKLTCKESDDGKIYTFSYFKPLDQQKEEQKK